MSQLNLTSYLNVPTVSLPNVSLQGFDNMQFNTSLPDLSVGKGDTGNFDINYEVPKDLKINNTNPALNDSNGFGFNEALNLTQAIANVAQTGLAYMNYNTTKDMFNTQKKSALASLDQRLTMYNNNVDRNTNVMNQLSGNAVGSNAYNQFNQTNALNNHKTYGDL